MFLSKVVFRPDILTRSNLAKVLEGNIYNYHQLLWGLFEQSKRDFLYRAEFAEEQRAGHETLRHSPLFFILSPQELPQDSPLFSVTSKVFSPHLTEGMKIDFRLRANPVVTKNGKRHDLVMDEQIAFYQRIAQDLGVEVAAQKGPLLQQLRREPLQPQLRDWLDTYLSQTRYFAEKDTLATAQLLGLAVQEAISQRLQSWLTENPSRQGIMSLATYFMDDEQTDAQREVSYFQWQAYQAHPLHQKGKHAQFRSVDLQGKLVVHDPERMLDLIRSGIGAAKGFGCGLMLIKPAQF